MSDSTHRRKVPSPVGNGGRSSRTRRTASRCVSDKNNRLKLTNHVFERSFSEPSHNRRRDGDSILRRPSPMRGLQTEESDPIVYLPRIRSEVFASSPTLTSLSSPSSSSPINREGNKREAQKVVISVAVEGSSGHVRAMVKLSSNVEKMIKIVVDKYREEERTPKLDRDSAFELHQSHFSIQCTLSHPQVSSLEFLYTYLYKNLKGRVQGLDFYKNKEKRPMSLLEFPIFLGLLLLFRCPIMSCLFLYFIILVLLFIPFT